MYYIYVILDRYQRFYIGYTCNLRRRLIEHKSGKVTSTKSKLPVMLLYYEASNNQLDAMKRERYLKSGPGRKYIKYRVRYDLNWAVAS